jgi:DNA-binding response OmpR family regulator
MGLIEPQTGQNAVYRWGQIFMTTALDDGKNVVESFKALCDAYLFKTIDTGKLLSRIRDLHLV